MTDYPVSRFTTLSDEVSRLSYVGVIFSNYGEIHHIRPLSICSVHVTSWRIFYSNHSTLYLWTIWIISADWDEKEREAATCEIKGKACGFHVTLIFILRSSTSCRCFLAFVLEGIICQIVSLFAAGYCLTNDERMSRHATWLFCWLLLLLVVNHVGSG